MFSGVGKTEAEMEAALAAGILCFNVESAAELDAPRRRRRPRRDSVAPVSFRVNPDVDPKTHPYIATGLKESKFGVAFADAPALYRRAATLPAHRRARHRHPHRLADHRARAVSRGGARRCSTSSTASRADGIALAHVDLGGGLGIRYRDESPVDARRRTRAMVADAVRGRRERCCSSRAGVSSATPACC